MIYTPVNSLSQVPGDRDVLLKVSGLGFLRHGLAVGRVRHTPERSHEEVLTRAFLPDGTDVTDQFFGKSGASDLVKEGAEVKYTRTGRMVVDQAASSVFYGESIGEPGQASILGFYELPDGEQLNPMETLPPFVEIIGRDGKINVTKPVLVKERRAEDYPYPRWHVAIYEFGHIRFRQGGIFPGNAGQMARYEGWVDVPDDVLEEWFAVWK